MHQGMVIKKIRKKQGKTLKYVADKVSRTPGWLSNIEHGRRKLTTEDALKIADALGVHIKEFFLTDGLNETFNNLSTGTDGI